MQSKNEVMVCEQLQPSLSIRGGAKILFDYMKDIPEDEIILNFHGSKFISRSFAQEYLVQKNQINKKIREIEVPENIDSILKLVENSPTPNMKKIIENL